MSDSEKILGRRELFKSFFVYMGDKIADYAKERVDRVMTPKGNYLRPPGAVEETEFLSLCTRCDDCINTCPAKAIRRYSGLTDVAIGTPVIIPGEKPCVLCSGLMCISACKTGALKDVDRVENIKMGTARLDNLKCSAWSGQDCQICFIKCPLQGEAIYLDDGKPVINAEKCVGCGVCEYACQTVNNLRAIKVTPKK